MRPAPVPSVTAAADAVEHFFRLFLLLAVCRVFRCRVPGYRVELRLVVLGQVRVRFYGGLGVFRVVLMLGVIVEAEGDQEDRADDDEDHQPAAQRGVVVLVVVMQWCAAAGAVLLLLVYLMVAFRAFHIFFLFFFVFYRQR